MKLIKQQKIMPTLELSNYLKPICTKSHHKTSHNKQELRYSPRIILDCNWKRNFKSYHFLKCNCITSFQIYTSTSNTRILDKKNLDFFQLVHFLHKSYIPADAAQLSAGPGCHLDHGHQLIALQLPLSSGRGHWGHSGTVSTPQSLYQSNCV